MNRRIRRLVQAWLLGACVLALGATYYQAIKADRLATSPGNPRVADVDREIIRGSILDRDGNVVSGSYAPGLLSRFYNGPGSLAPLIGYAGPSIGKAGLEAAYDPWLMGRQPLLNRAGLLWTLAGNRARGYSLGLTISSGVQRACERALAGRRGAAVVLNAATGEALAVASSPWFIPYGAEEMWGFTLSREDSPLLCRATTGLYPPGSTIKTAIVAAAIDAGVAGVDEVFQCSGSIRAGGTVIRDPGGAHGSVDLKTAVAVSCNVVAVELALRLGSSLPEALARYFLDRPAPFDIPTASARLGMAKLTQSGDILGQLGIGQGDLVVTPMHMAMAIAAAVNGGAMMMPYVVREIAEPDGHLVRVRRPRELPRPLSPAAAALVTEAMRAAVERGTAVRAGRPGYDIGGKTGTAQNPHGEPHAWFAGFAVDGSGERRVAMAIVLENAGAGGTAAAPLAGDILVTALDEMEVSG
ncbi:MAG: penicillin-binding transpeptidase domain-containing protein [Clostridia bacterium]|nr:penicillin-binding transpeptidase domain-containing protein [Clostridia bacterium]